MPELPEVETIVRQLNQRLAGKVIRDFEILEKKSFEGNSAEVVGQTVLSVTRRAKMAIFALSNDKFLLIHLKMSGQLILIDHKKRFAGGHASHDWHAELPNKHTRLIFDFGNTERLYFNDMRKFGWCKLLGKEELTHYLDGFGPDAIPDIDLKYLKERAARMPRSSVKKFILDQKILGGVGNIYTDESLFDAWINPKTLVSKLTDADWGRLKKSIIETLNFAIEKGGTTDSDYVNANGESGGMQDFLRVYHKAGEPCAGDCGGVVKREVVAGRGTYYCPSCQKEKK